MRTTRDPAVAALVLLWACTRAVVLFQLAPSNDIQLYFDCASATLRGEVPYLEHAFEYPPGAIFLVLLPRLFASTVHGYGLAFALFACAVDGLNTVLASRLGARVGHARVATLLYVCTTALLGELLVQRLDVFVAAIIAAALLSAGAAADEGRGWRGHRAEGWLALGAFVKLAPILLLPALWIARRSGVKGVVHSGVAATAALAALFLPALLATRGHALDWVRYHADRGLQIESTWANGLELGRLFGVVDVGVEFVFGAMHLTGDAARSLASASSIVLLVVFAGAGLALFARARAIGAATVDAGDPAQAHALLLRAACVLLLAVFVTAKVLSPQLLIWILAPLSALASSAGRPRGLGLSAIVVALLTGFIAKFAYQVLITLQGSAVILLTLRNVLLVGLLIQLLVWRPRDAGQRQRGSLVLFAGTVTAWTAAVVTTILASASAVSSTDFWLHRKIGEDIVRTHTIPVVDTYSATAAGAPFVAHEWLSGVILYAVDAWGGSAALVLLRIALVLIIMGLVIAVVPRRLRGHAVTAPVLLAALSAVEARAELRPHLLALVLLALLSLLLHRYGQGRRRTVQGGILVAVVALQVLWANLHGSVLVAPVLIVLTAAVARRGQRIPLAVTAVAALLASALNPRGFELLRFTVDTTFFLPPLRQHIQEWRPTWDVYAPSLSALSFVAIAVAVVGGVPFLRRARRWWGALARALLFAGAALFANRFQAEFVVVGAPVAVAALARAGRALRIPAAHGPWVASTLAFVMMLFLGGARMGFDYGDVPRSQVQLLRDSGLQGAVLNEYNDGGFLISELPPTIKPVIDGRLDVYGPERFQEYRNAWVSPDAMWSYAERHHVVAVLVDARDAPTVDQLQRDVRWRPLGIDSRHALFVRADERGQGP